MPGMLRYIPAGLHRDGRVRERVSVSRRLLIDALLGEYAREFLLELAVHFLAETRELVYANRRGRFFAFVFHDSRS